MRGRRATGFVRCGRAARAMAASVIRITTAGDELPPWPWRERLGACRDGAQSERAVLPGQWPCQGLPDTHLWVPAWLVPFAGDRRPAEFLRSCATSAQSWLLSRRLRLRRDCRAWSRACGG